jgi:hypothetical protein
VAPTSAITSRPLFAVLVPSARLLFRFCFVEDALWTYWSASTIRTVFAAVKLMLLSGVDFS